MADRQDESEERRAPGLDEIVDPEFQRRWIETGKLDREQVYAAFRHGFDSQDRFADRPFDEVDDRLRQSWEGTGPPAPWDRVAAIVRSGYQRGKGDW